MKKVLLVIGVAAALAVGPALAGTGIDMEVAPAGYQEALVAMDGTSLGNVSYEATVEATASAAHQHSPGCSHPPLMVLGVSGVREDAHASGPGTANACRSCHTSTRSGAT